MNTYRARVRVVGSAICAICLTACGGGGGNGDNGNRMGGVTTTPTPVFAVANIVSNGAVTAAHTDINLTNPWGISFAPGAPVWIANNGSNTSTFYDGAGVKQPPTVTIPPGTNGNAQPTGIVANTSTGFVISGTAGPALFIFSGEGGTIAAWAAANGSAAVTMYDDGAGGAVYKGLAINGTGTASRLYATDFHNNKIDVFDQSFAKITVTGGFTDAAMPAGFAPFGIQAVGNQLYVTYAKQSAPSNGAGLGYVDLFDLNGTLIKRVISASALNEPWGIAIAPAGFGAFANDLLIANFGDGTINAFDPANGALVGALKDSLGQTLVIPGLWGIAVGNGAFSQSSSNLYFTAGPNNEADGVYGSIAMTSAGAPAPPPPPGGY